tara:strand:+ start:6424 stop:6966 length:543 start_codon:yes stop_codon:yes gene_type:complete
MEPENYQATLDELNASSTSFVGIIIVAIIMIVSILSAISAVLAFLYTMTFFRIPEEHRKISLGKIWLVMVPFYGLYWLYMLTRELAASFRAYFEAQDPEDEPMPEGDFGQTYGLLMCISAALVHLAALAVFWKSPLILGLSMGISTALSLLLTVKYFLEVFKIRQRIPDPELEMLPESYI